METNSIIKIEGTEYIIISKYQHPQSENILLTLQLPKGKKQFTCTVYPEGFCSSPKRFGA